MKTKEPFGGFEQGSGHLSYHLAFFIAGWVVTSDTVYGEASASDDYDNTIVSNFDKTFVGFTVMRWSHCVSFLLDGMALMIEAQMFKIEKASKSRATGWRLSMTLFKAISLV